MIIMEENKKEITLNKDLIERIEKQIEGKNFSSVKVNFFAAQHYHY